MKKGFPVIIKIIPLLFALLAGQAAALVHDADHPFHEPSQDCDVFLALDKTESSIPVNANEFPFPGKHSPIRFDSTGQINSAPAITYRPRAPPLSP